MNWEIVSCWIESHPGLASWVQAVGSIAAIGVAIWVSGSERRYQAKIERLARKNSIDRAISAAEQALKVAKSNLDYFTCDSVYRGDVSKFRAVIDRASTQVASATEAPSLGNDVLGHLFEVTHALVDIQSLLDEFVSIHNRQSSISRTYLKDNVARIAKAIEGLESIRRSA